MPTTIAVTGVNNAGGYDRPLYQGSLPSSGPITWTALATHDSGQNYPAPLRGIPYLTGSALLQYDIDTVDWDSVMFGYDGAAFTSDPVLGWEQQIDYPFWEEFDLASSGRSIVVTPTSDSGPKLKISSDRGRTWGSQIDIDYLYDLLGATDYAAQYWYEQSFSIQYNEADGYFYLLCSWMDQDTYDSTWVLLKSTTGTTWDLVKSWPCDQGGYTLMYSYCSLAVSGSHIYVAFFDESSAVYCYHSANAGSTWAIYASPEANVYGISVAAHNEFAVLYMAVYASGAISRAVVMRTADGGTNWNQTLQVDIPVPVDSLIAQQVVRASGSVFAITWCGVHYPYEDAAWEGADEVVHDMSGVGDPYLCFWISIDDAETWELKTAPLGWPDYWQLSLAIIITVLLRGCFWPILCLLADDIPPCAPEKRPSTKCVTPGL